MSGSVQRLREVEAAIEKAARGAERCAAGITLIAVTKTVPADAITPILEAGHRAFGENYVQESVTKWPDLRDVFPDAVVHMIGPLQSNKAREAVGLFDMIHSLDRRSLAAALAKAIDATGKRPRLLCQVNTGEELQKGGLRPCEVDGFVQECRTAYHLDIEGLMCVPPASDPPSPHFALLAALAERNGLSSLSMGMSSDYAAAIQLGATHVRVGTAIFGERPRRLPSARPET